MGLDPLISILLPLKLSTSNGERVTPKCNSERVEERKNKENAREAALEEGMRRVKFIQKWGRKRMSEKEFVSWKLLGEMVSYLKTYGRLNQNIVGKDKDIF